MIDIPKTPPCPSFSFKEVLAFVEGVEFEVCVCVCVCNLALGAATMRICNGHPLRALLFLSVFTFGICAWVRWYVLRLQHDRLAILFETVYGILNSANVVYWADFGTLLGCTRANGLIWRDTDVDVAVLQQERPKVMHLEGKFEAAGIKINYRDCGPACGGKLRLTDDLGFYCDIDMFTTSSTIASGVYTTRDHLRSQGLDPDDLRPMKLKASQGYARHFKGFLAESTDSTIGLDSLDQVVHGNFPTIGSDSRRFGELIPTPLTITTTSTTHPKMQWTWRKRCQKTNFTASPWELMKVFCNVLDSAQNVLPMRTSPFLCWFLPTFL
jgi:hypothetical protein